MDGLIPITPAEVVREPTFAPWIGTEYARHCKALLAGTSSCCDGLWHVMGESHYGEAHAFGPDLTGRAIESLGFKGYPFFDKVLSVVSRKQVADLDRPNDWQRYAFSNFVQDLLPSRGVPRDWEKARQSFFGQLAITRPKQLLVVGKQAWENLPDKHYVRIPPLDAGAGWGTVDDALLYSYKVGEQVAFTIALWIYHPSSFGKFNLQQAQNRVRTVEMVSCNVLSQLDYADEKYFFDVF